MGASYGKKKSYSIAHEPPSVKPNGRANSDQQQQHTDDFPRRTSQGCISVPPPDYTDEDEELIKPRKLQNPVKASRSHQELHKELLSRGGSGGGSKPELQKVLESRKRDQLIRQRKQEEETRRRISPLEAELLKRQQKLEEVERQQQQALRAPEFVKVRENLRRTSFHSDEKEV